MRFIFYLAGILNAYLCSLGILEILNGDTSHFHMFLTVLTGAVGIACFAAAFNSLWNKIYGEENKND